MKATTQSNLRVLAYTLTIVLHGTNLLVMDQRMKDLDYSDDKVRFFAKSRHRFYTSWNFFLQMIYATIGLLCEILERSNSHKKEYRLPKHLRGLRDTLFAGVLWPSTFLTFTLFWSVYNYDNELILPKFTEKVLTPVTNHIVHTAIVPIVVWEAVFRPRQIPKSHKRNLTHIILYMLAYLGILLYTYFETGQMLYPIFHIFAKTIYFPIFIAIIGVFVIFAYYMQWVIVWLVHDSKSYRPVRKSKLK